MNATATQTFALSGNVAGCPERQVYSVNADGSVTITTTTLGMTTRHTISKQRAREIWAMYVKNLKFKRIGYPQETIARIWRSSTMKTRTAHNLEVYVKWQHAIVLPCPEYPLGLPGFVYIESQTQRGPSADGYLVVPIMDEFGYTQGYRFTSSTGKTDDVDDVHHSCECGDFLLRGQYRPDGCRHTLALKSMPPVVESNGWRSAAEASEHAIAGAILGPDGEPNEAA
jgi:hypothetical protein